MTLAAALLAACAAEPPAPVRDAIDVDVPAAWSAGGAQADGALRIDWWRERLANLSAHDGAPKILEQEPANDVNWIDSRLGRVARAAARRAEGRAELHERLIEVAGPLAS